MTVWKTDNANWNEYIKPWTYAKRTLYDFHGKMSQPWAWLVLKRSSKISKAVSMSLVELKTQSETERRWHSTTAKQGLKWLWMKWICRRFIGWKGRWRNISSSKLCLACVQWFCLNHNASPSKTWNVADCRTGYVNNQLIDSRLCYGLKPAAVTTRTTFPKLPFDSKIQPERLGKISHKLWGQDSWFYQVFRHKVLSIYDDLDVIKTSGHTFFLAHALPLSFGRLPATNVTHATGNLWSDS